MIISRSRSSNIGWKRLQATEQKRMAHDHDHPHNPSQPDDPEPRTYHELLGVALSDLLIEKGVYTKDDERRRIEQMESLTPAIGARVVARAWCDPAFAERLREERSADRFFIPWHKLVQTPADNEHKKLQNQENSSRGCAGRFKWWRAIDEFSL